MIDLDKYIRYYKPFNFLIGDSVFDDDLLKKLVNSFPPVEEIMGSKSGRVYIDATSPKFENVLASRPEWKELYTYLSSSTYVNKMLNYFRDELNVNEIGFPATKPFVLTGDFHERTSKSDTFFVHFDFSKGYDSYFKEIHHDGGQRVINMLIYFNEPEQEGGDLILYKTTKYKHIHEQFNPTDVKEHVRLTPHSGLSVIWLSTPNSYHSVPLIKNTKVPRNFIYVSISTKKRFAWRYGGKWHGEQRLEKAYAKEIGKKYG